MLSTTCGCVCLVLLSREVGWHDSSWTEQSERCTLPMTVPMRVAGHSKRYSTIAPAADLLTTPACGVKADIR